MLTATISETPDPQPPSEAPRHPLPAAYYSGPAPTRVLPKWATFGCGGVALLILIGIFVGASLVSRGGLNEFLDFAVSMSVTEMKGMYTADVQDAQKKAFDVEIERVRKDLREGRASIQTLEPMLRAMRSAMADGKVDRAEVEGMTTTARKVKARKP